MDCRTCVHSNWDYPSLGCRSCRGYSNHSTTLALPGTTIHAELTTNKQVDAAIATITKLTEQVMYGNGEECTKASELLSKISRAFEMRIK